MKINKAMKIKMAQKSVSSNEHLNFKIMKTF